MSDHVHSDAKTVLVVEDDPFLRMDAVDILEDAGVETLEAGDTASALALLDGHGVLRAIFTDVELPGPCNGLEFARMVHERYPEAAIVLTSGNWKFGESALPKGSQFLAKPYRPADVYRALQVDQAIPA